LLKALLACRFGNRYETLRFERSKQGLRKRVVIVFTLLNSQTQSTVHCHCSSDKRCSPLLNLNPGTLDVDSLMESRGHKHVSRAIYIRQFTGWLCCLFLLDAAHF
jgi:hypothetical protein